MAKPKEKTGQLSAAFHEKSGKEKDRLKKKLAKQLKEDMESMLQELIHPDLEFSLRGGNSVGHRLILKARARKLWDLLCEGRAGADNFFKLSHVDKSVWDAYLFQVYGSDQAELAAEELMLSMEERSEPCRDSTGEVFGPGDVTATPADRGGVTRRERYSVDSLEDGQSGSNSDMPLITDMQRDDHLAGAEHGMAVGGQPEFSTFNLYQGAYNLDLGPSAYFAAGQDYLAADPSSLFVLPNGQEINNNDANNNGLDANQVMPDQNLQPQRELQIVNLETQVVDLVSHAFVQPHNPQAPVSLLADIQTQQRSGPATSAGALSELPDVIKASYCTALPHETCSRLGEDLLRAYLQEIDCDCTISVGSQDFKCHRCILAARSTYFTAMLGGRWLESEADKIILEGVSASAVEQALLYIYGGVFDLTDQCNVSELILLSDMYGVDGLKEVISLHLRMVKCHFFHKPCAGCTTGVVESLCAAERYRMEELLDRCIKWINKNFTKIWPTKIFAQLPEATLQACCKSAIQDLHPETVLDVIMDCDKLSTCLPRLKWTEPVLDLITLLMDSAMEYTSQHFTSVLASERFMALGKSQAWSMSLLDTIFGSVIKSLPVDHICNTYLAVHRLVELTKDENCSWTEDFQGFVQCLLEKCDSYIKLYIHQVVHCRHWEKLTKDIQQHLLQNSSYVCIDAHRGRAPPKLSSMNKRPILSSSSKSRPVKVLTSGKTKAQGVCSTKGGSAKSENLQKIPKKAETVAQLSSKPTQNTGFGVRSGTAPSAKRRTNSAIPRLTPPRTTSNKQGTRTDSRQMSHSMNGSSALAVTDRTEFGIESDGSSRVTRETIAPDSAQSHSAPGSFADTLSVATVTTDLQRVLLGSDTNISHTPVGHVTPDSDVNLNKTECGETGSSQLIATDSSHQAVSNELSSSSEEFEDILSSKSDPCVPPSDRSGFICNVSASHSKVSRSRSEDLSLLRNGENYVLQLHPIFEPKFVLPKGSFCLTEKL